jgi:hypothetical protein
MLTFMNMLSLPYRQAVIRQQRHQGRPFTSHHCLRAWWVPSRVLHATDRPVAQLTNEYGSVRSCQSLEQGPCGM